MTNWKIIVAFAVFACPLAWCEAQSAKSRADKEIVEIEACAKVGGAWSNSWRGYCDVGAAP